MRMVLQVAWLLVSYAFLAAMGGLMLDRGPAWAAAVLLVGVPAWRIARRFRPDTGYRLMGAASEPGELGDYEIRATRQARPTLFKVMLALELAIVCTVLAIVTGRSTFPFAESFDAFVRCTLGSGAHEVCLR